MGPMADRKYDVVVFGATGFTGGLTAEYLAQRATPTPHNPLTRWALAGRSLTKLEQTRTHLETIEPASVNLDLIEAETGAPDSSRPLGGATHAVVTHTP